MSSLIYIRSLDNTTISLNNTNNSLKKLTKGYIINIYHKGCGTMGVPVFASENIELTFAFNFKKYQRKNIVKSYKLHATTSSKARFLNNIFFLRETHICKTFTTVYIYTLRGLIFAWINFCECRPRKISRRLIFANGQA